MFEKLPQYFRMYDLEADVRTLIVLRKAVQSGLVKTLGDLYAVLKGIVVKSPEDIGPFTRAYYAYFLDIDIENGETLSDAILRSETFRNWRTDFLKEELKDFTEEELIDTFLDQVHLTSYDIKEIISGKELFDKDRGDLEDEDGNPVDGDSSGRPLDRMADYSDLSLEELMERMKEVAEQQKGKHKGGSHWIGTEGISPYGHGGAAKDGIRVGGTGGGKMARAVFGDSRFFPVDRDSILNDNNVDAALASLKGITEESAHEQLDVPTTIKDGLRRGGLFIPELESIKDERLQVILLIDNGGYSMTPYVRSIQQLFKKMKTRFAHDLETYYFHNTIYDRVFTDSRRTKSFMVKRLLQKDPNYRIFIIGDASMAPYELNKTSMETYFALTKKFKKTAWLNPEPVRYWEMSMTIALINRVFDMYPLTPRGIEKAVLEMNRKKL